MEPMSQAETNPATESAEGIPPSASLPVDQYESNMHVLLKRAPPEEIPAEEDLYTEESLQRHLDTLCEPPLSLITVGDIMLGGRAKRAVAEHGADYPFAEVLPVLRRAPVVLASLEGPLALKARRQHRNHSYRVNPALATALTRAGINLVTLANNHLLDCGRSGVLETLEALALAGVASLGAGVNKDAAHRPVVRQAGRLKIGFLGYYWNRRCAATADRPGSAMDPPEALKTDMRGLRDQVDRIVVTFHWGVPYEREPSPEDRAKARFAVDCGADAVVAHHPHIIQPFEVYRGRPIFFSVGNFAFGSGNSRAEGLLVGIRFEDSSTAVEVYPLYVKNRDPRVNYQPKLLRGKHADQILCRLAAISGSSGGLLKIEQGQGRLNLPCPDPHCKKSEVTVA
jgi:poly-gamma-glutamate capsule biosynthesis protein CapA/YwtB (metallophosphatase superfamily)